MILKDEDVDERLDSPNNLINKLKVKVLPHGGRKEGQLGVPDEVRKLIGGLANASDERQADIAKVFGVSQPTVSAAKRGLVGDRFDEEVSESNDEVKKATVEDAHESALNCLMDSLGSLGGKLKEEKTTLKAKELSKIATDMSRVVGTLKPAEKEGNNSHTQVVVFMPVQRKENQYEVIDA